MDSLGGMPRRLHGEGDDLLQRESDGRAPAHRVRGALRPGAAPRFDEADIVKEKQVVLEEIKMDEDNPESVIPRIVHAEISGPDIPWVCPSWAHPKRCAAIFAELTARILPLVVCAEQHGHTAAGRIWSVCAAGGHGRRRVRRERREPAPRQRARPLSRTPASNNATNRNSSKCTSCSACRRTRWHTNGATRRRC